MKRRLVGFLLVFSLSLFVALPALGAATLSNFEAHIEYGDQFSDVALDAWYYESVRGVFERGLMGGKSEDSFDPSGQLTIAETIKLAACLHKCYHTGSMDLEPGSPWYAPYVDYSISNGIIEAPYSNYDAAATRSDFALIIDGALPDEAVTPINRVVEGSIPDVMESYSYGEAVYRLYRAGVLTGSDSDGTYYPGRTLRRSEAAVIVMRIVNADMRQSFFLPGSMTAEQVYRAASPAVFYIEVFNADGIAFKTGSGFFISDSGLAVTNYHVLIGGHSAKVTMDNGDVHDVTGIFDYDWKNDIAVINVDASDVPFLARADSSSLMTGATVYTLGSPLGLHATFSRGIVSQSLRELEGVGFIQIDAPISSGSSGGALLDSSGRAIGVTCATAVEGQNINLAVPINHVDDLDLDTAVPLDSIIPDTPTYDDHPAPDFGAFFGVNVFKKDTSGGETSFSYLLSGLRGSADSIMDAYSHLVEQFLFSHNSTLLRGDVSYKMYFHPYFEVMIAFGVDVVDGRDCFTVKLM